MTTSNYVMIDGKAFAPGHRLVKARAASQNQATNDFQGADHTQTPSKRVKTRIRQSQRPLMNKLEQEFYDAHRDKYPNCPPLRAQAVTFRLANSLKYTPDFTCGSWPESWINPEYGTKKFTAFEIKGKKVWDDAICKIKMAAAVFPEINWWLVWKQDSEWSWQRVLP